MGLMICKAICTCFFLWWVWCVYLQSIQLPISFWRSRDYVSLVSEQDDSVVHSCSQPVTIPPLYKLQAEASRAIEIGPCPRALKLVSSFCATYWNPLVLATPWNWVSLHCPLKNLLPQESHEDFQVVSLDN